MPSLPHTQVSRSVPISQAIVDAFAVISQDSQWIHTDPKRAANTKSGGTIAHGMLVAALIPTLVGEIVDMRPEVSKFNSASGTPVAVINLGFSRLDFAAPVPVATSIRVETATVAIEEGLDRLEIRADFVVWAELNRDRIAAAGILKLRYTR